MYPIIVSQANSIFKAPTRQMKKLKAFLGGSYIPEEYWDEWVGNRKTKVSEQELVFPEEAVARLIQDYMENKEGAFFLYDQNGRPKKNDRWKGLQSLKLFHRHVLVLGSPFGWPPSIRQYGHPQGIL
jgi:hypothetical protein